MYIIYINALFKDEKDQVKRSSMNTIIQDSEATVSTASGSATDVTDSPPPPSAEAQAHEDGPPAQPSPSPLPFNVVMASKDPDALYSGGGIRCLSLLYFLLFLFYFFWDFFVCFCFFFRI